MNSTNLVKLYNKNKIKNYDPNYHDFYEKFFKIIPIKSLLEYSNGNNSNNYILDLLVRDILELRDDCFTNPVNMLFLCLNCSNYKLNLIFCLNPIYIINLNSKLFTFTLDEFMDYDPKEQYNQNIINHISIPNASLNFFFDKIENCNFPEKEKEQMLNVILFYFLCLINSFNEDQIIIIYKKCIKYFKINYFTEDCQLIKLNSCSDKAYNLFIYKYKIVLNYNEIFNQQLKIPNINPVDICDSCKKKYKQENLVCPECRKLGSINGIVNNIFYNCTCNKIIMRRCIAQCFTD